MTLETTVNDLTLAVTALTTSVQDKRTVLDAAAQAAAASLTTTKGLQTQAAASAATAAAKATEATNNATQIAAYKTAAAALNTSTTATAAVTNLLPDMLAKKDPARHPFRKKMPTLVLDFERQKCHRYSPSTGFGETPLLPFMTFARNSSATYTGPDGLIKTAAANEPRFDYDPLTGECKGLLVEEQRTNLALDSGATHAAKWNFIECTLSRTDRVGPDGTLQGFNVYGVDSVECSPRIEGISSAYTAGTVVTVTTVLAAGTSSIVHVGCCNSTTGWFLAVVNLATGVITKTASGSGATYISGSVINIGSAYKISVTGSIAAGSTIFSTLRIGGVLTNPTLSVWGLKGEAHTKADFIRLYSVQLEAGSFPTSYIPTPATFTGRASTATYLDANGVVQTAASGVARSDAYDYDADGVLRPIGLLLESAATNLLTYSEKFDNASWMKAYITTTANATTAPDGTTTAYKLVESTDYTAHDIYKTLSSPSVSTAYTFSIYAKSAERSMTAIQLNNGVSTVTAKVNLSDGSVFSASDGVIVKVTKAASGFWRIAATVTTPASATMLRAIIFTTLTDGTTTYTGDGTSGIYVWGAQLEAGSYATSYIPTTSAQVTRAADTSTSAQATRAKDAAKVDGVNFSDWHNIDGFTAFATYEWGVDVNQQAFGRGVFGFSDTNNSNSWCYVYNGSTRSALVANTNSGQQFYKTSDSPNEPANVMRSIAFRYKKNNAAVSFNGGSVASDTNCELPVFNNLNIGSTSLSNVYRLGGHVKRIVVYPTAFTDEELQALTSA